MSDSRVSMATRRAALTGVIITLLVLMLGRLAKADTITIRNGGDGEISISTPWGDYAVYDEGGGTYWVGTQREFDRVRVIGIAQSHGARLSLVNSDGADATFVSAKTYRTFVGGVALDNITPGIMFSVPKNPPRPAIPNSHRYVAVNWIGGGASLILVDPKNATVIHAYDHGVVDGNWYSEFSVPVSALTKKMLMVFTIPGRKPGIVSLRSIAYADYQISLATVAELRDYDIAPDAEQMEQLRKLHLLDPSMGSAEAATTQPKIAPSPASLIALTMDQKYVFQNGMYPWSCTDPNNSHDTVIVNQGDDFLLNSGTRPQDTTYSVTIRPERYTRSTPFDPVHDSGMCVIDAKILNAMVGIKGELLPHKTPPNKPLSTVLPLIHRSFYTPSGAMLDLEIADTKEAQERGLTGRSDLPLQHGMAFIFPSDQNLNFWMKDTPFALDFIFIKRDGTITAIQTLKGSPPGSPGYAIPRTEGYGAIVIAIPEGESEASGYHVGDVISNITEKLQ